MDRWYQDPRLLKAAYREYGSFEAIEREIGGADATTLSKWWRRHKLGSLTYGPDPKTRPNREALQRLSKRIFEEVDE